MPLRPAQAPRRQRFERLPRGDASSAAGRDERWRRRFIALARNDPRARAALAAAWEAGVEVAVPAIVLAETVRGTAKDAPVNRVLKAVGEVLAADEQVGRSAGGLLGAARSRSTVDALVVASALRVGGGVVLTGDPDDLTALASGHREVLVQPP